MTGQVTADTLVHAMWADLVDFDEDGFRASLAAAHALGVDAMVCHVILPLLKTVGDRWESGEISVAHEHFAAQLIREHLIELRARDSHSDSTRRAVLACPSGERHDLPLLCFDVLLRQRGWAVRYLGADTPLTAVASAAYAHEAGVVVLAASRETVLTSRIDALPLLSARQPLALGGKGATDEVCRAADAVRLDSDMAVAVEQLDALVRG